MAQHRPSPTFYEFFAGGGMARAGLTAAGWQCLFANDFDAKKVSSYVENWGGSEIVHGDVGRLDPTELPHQADAIWASFPCQDLSLAGGGAGLKGNRSGTFWPFWSIVKGLIGQGRAPKVVVLENVCGTLTSHGGQDFKAICSALVDEGFKVGAVVIDAALFVPHSRPRLFVIGVRGGLGNAVLRQGTAPNPQWHSRTLLQAHESLPFNIKESWIWWDLPKPEPREHRFVDLVERAPNDVRWHDEEETQRILDMMSAVHLKKIDKAKSEGNLVVGTVYRRTRNEEGGRVQRAEVRFDDVAGCLRTPAGGSSRQILIFVEGQRVRSRLISARETARLMGLSDSYALPPRYNDAYHLTGDGVAVPVVEFLANSLLNLVLAGHPETLVA